MARCTTKYLVFRNHACILISECLRTGQCNLHVRQGSKKSNPPTVVSGSRHVHGFGHIRGGKRHYTGALA